MKKRLLYIVLTGLFFLYGFSIGHFKIFPFQQLLALKHTIEHRTGTFENNQQLDAPSDVEVLETLLTRLLLKKVQIPGYNGHGGGISVTGDILFLITNKGSVQLYTIESFTAFESRIPDVPMNFNGLIQSGHPYKNNFRINWFRVNGVYSEPLNDSTYRIFVSHNAYDSGGNCITHNISRIEIEINGSNAVQKNDWETIFTASPCIDPEPEDLQSSVPYPGHISGGAISNFDNDHLIATVGDYNRHGIDGADEYAMDKSNPYGKFILVNKNSGEWSVFATGSRNAPGLYIDENSIIWSVENGPEGGDELNIVMEGENYGWPKVSYGIWYNPSFILPGNEQYGTHPHYKKPVFSWIPSVAPSSLIKIEGNSSFGLWNGDLLMGTMRDQSLHRLRLDDEHGVIYDERISIGHRIRDIVTLPDNQIVLLTDDGYLIIIEDGGPVYREMDTDAFERMARLGNFDRSTHSVDTLSNNVYENSARMIYEQNCATCHNLNPVNQIGPHLNELIGREIGGVDNFNYSQTLRSDNRMWDRNLLQSYLENPENEFSGTRMQKINLSEAETDSIIQYLKNHSIE